MSKPSLIKINGGFVFYQKIQIRFSIYMQHKYYRITSFLQKG